MEHSEGFTSRLFVGEDLAETVQDVCTEKRIMEITQDYWFEASKNGCTKIEVIREFDNSVIKTWK